MSFELTAGIILFLGLLGMTIIIFRKIPALIELSDIPPVEGEKKLFSKLKEKIKILNPLKSLSYEVFLQKTLSKIRILSLKSENKTYNWLKRLRIKAKIRKNLDANYWEEIKKSTKE